VSAGRRRALVVAGVAAGVAYAAVAAQSRPLTGAAAVAVAVPAVVVLAAAARRPRPRSVPAAAGPRPDVGLGPGAQQVPAPGGPGGLRRTALAWAVLAALATAVELVAFLRQPAYNVGSPDHPTISLLLDPLTGAGPSRFAAWCCWLGLGWAVLRR
jgi:hypothetical protein